jgi:putative (di)nucleoside polyphosphate hydrolase
METKSDHLYRKGVGLMLINNDNKIFVGKRIDNHSDAWQMPQGGIDYGENEDFAVIREMQEETGIDSKNIKILAKSADYFYYNLPYNLQKKFWGGKYIGQKQRWYLARFCGQDSDINITCYDPEFSDWKWVSGNELIKLIVSFKQELYKQIVKEFANFL